MYRSRISRVQSLLQKSGYWRPTIWRSWVGEPRDAARQASTGSDVMAA